MLEILHMRNTEMLNEKRRDAHGRAIRPRPIARSGLH